MSIEIQFLEGVKEETLPLIRLTKSKNGKTGTATFLFIAPKTITKTNNSNISQINGMYLIWKNKKITTTDITIYFQEGKPFIIKAILIFKNSKDWFEFLYFMNYYSKERGLTFSQTSSSF